MIIRTTINVVDYRHIYLLALNGILCLHFLSIAKATIEVVERQEDRSIDRSIDYSLIGGSLF